MFIHLFILSPGPGRRSRESRQAAAVGPQWLPPTTGWRRVSSPRRADFRWDHSGVSYAAKYSNLRSYLLSVYNLCPQYFIPPEVSAGEKSSLLTVRISHRKLNCLRIYRRTRLRRSGFINWLYFEQGLHNSTESGYLDRWRSFLAFYVLPLFKPFAFMFPTVV